jgi:hypothetical protein
MALKDGIAMTPSNVPYVILYRLLQIMFHTLSSAIYLDMLFTFSRLSLMTSLNSIILVMIYLLFSLIKLCGKLLIFPTYYLWRSFESYVSDYQISVESICKTSLFVYTFQSPHLKCIDVSSQSCGFLYPCFQILGIKQSCNPKKKALNIFLVCDFCECKRWITQTLNLPVAGYTYFRVL